MLLTKINAREMIFKLDSLHIDQEPFICYSLILLNMFQYALSKLSICQSGIKYGKLFSHMESEMSSQWFLME